MNLWLILYFNSIRSFLSVLYKTCVLNFHPDLHAYPIPACTWSMVIWVHAAKCILSVFFLLHFIMLCIWIDLANVIIKPVLGVECLFVECDDLSKIHVNVGISLKLNQSVTNLNIYQRRHKHRNSHMMKVISICQISFTIKYSMYSSRGVARSFPSQDC